jgi:steroid 5-alpha reductase family enzyme
LITSIKNKSQNPCIITIIFNFVNRYGNLIFHEEDYRWPILREKMSSITFFFFNLSFIATFQNVLLWLITYPAYVVLQSKRHHIHFIDIILAGFFLLLLVMETIADQQHYNFHTAKVLKIFGSLFS